MWEILKPQKTWKIFNYVIFLLISECISEEKSLHDPHPRALLSSLINADGLIVCHGV